MNGFWRSIMMLLCSMFLIPSQAWAGPTLPSGTPSGGCWADPMNQLVINLALSHFPSNKKGTEAEINFKTSPSSYPGWCYSTEGRQLARYFRSEMKLPPSNLHSGWFQLTDDVDVRVIINPSTNFPYSLSPFTDSYVSASDVNAGPTGYGVTDIGPTGYGNYGIIRFKLRHNIIGGGFLIPTFTMVANLFRYVNKSQWAPVPIYELYTQIGIVPVPTICSINNGSTINVDFGDVDSSLIRASGKDAVYRVQKALNYSCNNSITQDIQVKFVGEGAAFDSGALSTSNKNLAVELYHKNIRVKPGYGYDSRLDDGSGGDSVEFVLVKNPVKSSDEILTGPFSASATLIITNL